MSARPISPAPSPRVRTTRALDVFAAICAMIALGLVLWPKSTDMVTTAAAREPDASGTPASATAPVADPATMASLVDNSRNDSLIAAVVNGNVFSASRHAPTTRFVAPGERSMVTEAPPAYDAGRTEATSGDSLPRLSGIVAINGERRALLQLAAADESPKLYRVTESHAGYRIVQIGPDFVVLASRAGTRTLRLSRGAPPDSLEKQP